MNTVAFTGHRPHKLDGYNPGSEYNQRLLQALGSVIERLIAQHSCFSFICGGALGIDQWAAELVLMEKHSKPWLELTLALPFEGFDAKWPETSRLTLRQQILKADRHFYISAPGYQAWKLQARNEWMVNHANIVVAVWDGTAGGTANCVASAKKLGKPVIHLNPNTLNTTWP